MKKILLAVLAAGLLSSPAMAFSPGNPNLPDDIAPIWNGLKNKRGTTAYLSFIATRNYIDAAVGNDNPPKMPKNFNWDYVGASEAQGVQDAVMYYYANHPTATA